MASRRRHAEEDGAGLISTIAGTLMFLVLLFFAAHLLLNLYATSVVTANAFDTARVAAGRDAGTTLAARQAAAQQHWNNLMGSQAAASPITVSTQGDNLSLRVTSDGPDLLWRQIMSPLGIEAIDRTIVVRLEQ